MWFPVGEIIEFSSSVNFNVNFNRAFKEHRTKVSNRIIGTCGRLRIARTFVYIRISISNFFFAASIKAVSQQSRKQQQQQQQQRRRKQQYHRPHQIRANVLIPKLPFLESQTPWICLCCCFFSLLAQSRFRAHSTIGGWFRNSRRRMFVLSI